MRQRFPVSGLVKLGSKRKWVPMWLWVNVFFRFEIYRIWPIGNLIAVRAPSEGGK